MIVGPLYFDGENYKDSNLKKADGSGYCAQWYTLKEAEDISKDLNIGLEEV